MSTHRLTRGKLLFVVGFALGLTTSVILLSSTLLTQSDWDRRFFHQEMSVRVDLSQAAGHPGILPGQGMDKAVLSDSGEARVVRFDDLHEHHDDDRLAKKLSSRIRVLVWVMTGPQNLDKRAVHVRNTWGRRVDKLLFMSSEWNHTFPTIGLDVPEGRDHLTAKTMKAFRYVYDHHLDDADWFMKADDDTYVIMENLRYLLSTYNTQDPIYFGKVFNMAVKQGYASGGAGYVLSKEALRRLATIGYNSSLCHQDGGAEDAEMGICLNTLGVKLLPSTDRLGRSRFHCFSLEYHLQGGFPYWFFIYDSEGGRSGMDTISDYPITFHYIKPKTMYAMEYFTYHLRPYGIVSRTQDLSRNDSYTVLS